MAVQKLPVSPKGRVSFQSVFRPKVWDESKDPDGSYELTLIFPPEADLSVMKAEAAKAVKEKWGSNPPGGLRSPFRECEEKAGQYEGFGNGGTFVRFSTRTPPGVVGLNTSDAITEASGRFYDGCWARVTYSAACYDNKSRGVKFYLGNIQKMADDEPLGFAKTNPEDDFDTIESAEGPIGAEDLF